MTTVADLRTQMHHLREAIRGVDQALEATKRYGPMTQYALMGVLAEAHKRLSERLAVHKVQLDRANAEPMQLVSSRGELTKLLEELRGAPAWDEFTDRIREVLG